MGCLQSKSAKIETVADEVKKGQQENKVNTAENQESKEGESNKERPGLRVRWKSDLYEILNPSARKIVDGLTGKAAAFKAFSPSFY